MAHSEVLSRPTARALAIRWNNDVGHREKFACFGARPTALSTRRPCAGALRAPSPYSSLPSRMRSPMAVLAYSREVSRIQESEPGSEVPNSPAEMLRCVTNACVADYAVAWEHDRAARDLIHVAVLNTEETPMNKLLTGVAVTALLASASALRGRQQIHHWWRYEFRPRRTGTCRYSYWLRRPGLLATHRARARARRAGTAGSDATNTGPGASTASEPGLERRVGRTGQ